MSQQIGKYNEHIYWNVLCIFTIDGKDHKYLYISNNSSFEDSLKEARQVHVWSKHPTFKAEVIGIRFE